MARTGNSAGVGVEGGRVVHQPHLALSFTHYFQKTLGQLDRVLLRTGLDDRVAADYLLRLGERPVRNRGLAVGSSDPRTLRARLQSIGGDEGPILRHVFDELAHRRHVRRARRDVLVARLVQHHVTHRSIPRDFRVELDWRRFVRDAALYKHGESPGSKSTRNSAGEITSEMEKLSQPRIAEIQPAP